MTTHPALDLLSRWHRTFSVHLIGLLSLVLAACGGGGGDDAAQPAVTPTSISAQPTSVSVTAGASAAFSVTATGDALLYQWSTSVDDGATWTVIPGAAATGATYTVMAAVPQLSGSQFRVVVTGNGGSVTSSAATLTVTTATTPVGITVQPAAQTAVVGATATFSVTATGTSLTYQWQTSADGSTWTDIDLATAASYTTPPVTSADNGRYFRVQVTGPDGSVTSNAAQLTVQTGEGTGTGTLGPNIGTACTQDYTALPAGMRVDVTGDNTVSGYTTSTSGTAISVGPAIFQGISTSEFDVSGDGLGFSLFTKIYATYDPSTHTEIGYGATAHVASADGSVVQDTTTTQSNPTPQSIFDLALNQSRTFIGTSTEVTIITSNGVAGAPVTTTNTTTLTTTFLGTEVVTTPAGTFNTCKYQNQSDGGSSFNWYMVGYGVDVKSEDTGSPTTSQLTSFKVNGVAITRYP